MGCIQFLHVIRKKKLSKITDVFTAMEKAKHIQVIQGVIDIQKGTILCSLFDTKWTFPWSHSSDPES